MNRKKQQAKKTGKEKGNREEMRKNFRMLREDAREIRELKRDIEKLRKKERKLASEEEYGKAKEISHKLVKEKSKRSRLIEDFKEKFQKVKSESEDLDISETQLERLKNRIEQQEDIAFNY